MKRLQRKVRNEVPSASSESNMSSRVGCRNVKEDESSPNYNGLSIFESRLQKVPMPVQIVGVTVMEVSTTASGDERPRLVVRVVTDDDIPLSSPIKDLTR